MRNASSSGQVNSASLFECQGQWSGGFGAASEAAGGSGVIVGPGTDNPNVFAQTFEVKENRHFKLQAHACSADGGQAKGRFQVNWLDEEGGFISASIEKFDVGPAAAHAKCHVMAPAEAVTGVIYVAPGGRADTVRYYEMSLYLDGDPPPQPTVAPVPKFPANLIHLSDPDNWAQFGNLFRGYDDELVLKEMIVKVVGSTMVTYDGLLGLLSIVRYCETIGVRGSFVEIGSWRGGCAGLMALGAQKFGDGNRRIEVFDSFQGLPQPIASKDFDGFLEPMFDLDESNSQGKLEPIDMLVASETDVRDLLFGTIKYREDRVSIHKGWFQETIPVALDSVTEIAILRLDGDLYDSYVVALEHLYPKVVQGGFVIIDDWVLGGCRKAVIEYFEKNGLRPYLWTLDATTRCFQKY